MPVNFNDSSENIPDKGSNLFPIGEGKSAAKLSFYGADDPGQKKFPNAIDAEVNAVAREEFDNINEGARLQVVSKMFVPEDKSPVKGVNFHRITTHVDTYRILSKEGFYQKWIKAVSDSTQKEADLERQENRLKKYQGKMKDRFLDYLKNIQEKRNGGSAAAA